MKFTAKQIASFINGEVVGNENAEVYTFAKIEEGIPGALSFLANPKYTDYIGHPAGDPPVRLGSRRGSHRHD